jgi:hypothetical protein
MGPSHPELIVHRSGAVTGAASFEESLRETVRNAPYLGVALLVHLAVLLLFLNIKHAIPVPAEVGIVRASFPEELPVTAPAEIKPVEPMEEVPPTIESPTVSELPADDSTMDLGDESLNASLFAAVDGQIGTGAGIADVRGFHGNGPRGRGRGDNVGAPTNEAVRDALMWLKHHQAPGGYWSSSEFDDQCGQQGTDTLCDGLGSPLFDVGVTGLSLLAFLGAGNTEKSGDFQSTVKIGVKYLLDIQEADGSLVPRNSTQGTYDHVIATLALCETYAYGRRYQLKRPTQDALNALYAMRTPGSGWRYTPQHIEMRDPSRSADTSVTGWAILAMSTARKAGLYVDEDAWADSLQFLDEMTDPVTGRTGYIDRGGSVAREASTEAAWPANQSEAMTAVALLCRIFADPDLTDPTQKQLVELGVSRLLALPPVWDDDLPGRRDYYYWYYAAYALYQIGGQPWRTWEHALLQSLLPRQHRTGERRGSWDPQEDPWGRAGGRVYATAINTLTLEVYYRYDRLTGSGR